MFLLNVVVESLWKGLQCKAGTSSNAKPMNRASKTSVLQGGGGLNGLDDAQVPSIRICTPLAINAQSCFSGVESEPMRVYCLASALVA